MADMGKIVGKYNYSSMLGIPEPLYRKLSKMNLLSKREDYKQQEAKYYVYADPEKTHYILCHLCPTRRNRELLYKFPTLLEQPADHAKYLLEILNKSGLS